MAQCSDWHWQSLGLDTSSLSFSFCYVPSTAANRGQAQLYMHARTLLNPDTNYLNRSGTLTQADALCAL